MGKLKWKSGSKKITIPFQQRNGMFVVVYLLFFVSYLLWNESKSGGKFPFRDWGLRLDQQLIESRSTIRKALEKNESLEEKHLITKRSTTNRHFSWPVPLLGLITPGLCFSIRYRVLIERRLERSGQWRPAVLAGGGQVVIPTVMSSRDSCPAATYRISHPTGRLFHIFFLISPPVLIHGHGHPPPAPRSLPVNFLRLFPFEKSTKKSPTASVFLGATELLLGFHWALTWVIKSGSITVRDNKKIKQQIRLGPASWPSNGPTVKHCHQEWENRNIKIKKKNDSPKK